MRNDQVTMLEKYGPFKEGEDYAVQGLGRDFFRLRCRGTIYCVPSVLIDGGKGWGVDAKRKPFKRRPHKKRRQRQLPAQSK